MRCKHAPHGWNLQAWASIHSLGTIFGLALFMTVLFGLRASHFRSQSRQALFRRGGGSEPS